ncbi:MAG: hypothetical protein CSA70_02555 [Rhodobacterales bacterium]|nr:MAG: hypothetical protein CSA70_02555 [Rhodobacterales bacterium]
MMQINDVISHFSPLDFSALTVLCLALIGIGWRIEHPGAQVSVSVLMAQYRREWMQQMLFRDPRIFDAQALSNLRQGTAFFASATMIALGGALALIGNAEQIQGIARDLSLDQTPTAVWEIKLLITALLLANAFLKFVWSNRLFGYCMVVMAAVPLSPTDPVSISRARKAAEINITAARSFNRGLRAIYFAMASLAFMLGPVPLMLAVGITVLILWRREFASQSRSVLLHPPEG